MEINSINAAEFARLFLAGAANLEAKKEWINELNVFPVPDGDTGTNMSMTILSAAKEVEALANPDMKSLAKAISSGSLRGAEEIPALFYPSYSGDLPRLLQNMMQLRQKLWHRPWKRRWRPLIKPL